MAANTTSPDGAETRAVNETLKRGILLGVAANWANILLFMVGWWVNVLYHRLNPKIWGDPYWNVALGDIVGTMISFCGCYLIVATPLAIMEAVAIGAWSHSLLNRQRLNTAKGVLIGVVVGIFAAVVLVVALLMAAVGSFGTDAGTVFLPDWSWLYYQLLIVSILGGGWLGWRMARWLRARVA